MTKRNYGKRVAAGILAAIVAMTSSVPGFGGGMTVEAASSWQSENLLVNPDFEDAKAFGQATTSHLGNWFAWQSASKTTASASLLINKSSISCSGNPLSNGTVIPTPQKTAK